MQNIYLIEYFSQLILSIWLQKFPNQFDTINTFYHISLTFIIFISLIYCTLNSPNVLTNLFDFNYEFPNFLTYLEILLILSIPPVFLSFLANYPTNFPTPFTPNSLSIFLTYCSLFLFCPPNSIVLTPILLNTTLFNCKSRFYLINPPMTIICFKLPLICYCSFSSLLSINLNLLIKLKKIKHIYSKHFNTVTKSQI